LLFQVLRDDFLSFFVRGCWLVSFFFTPIYMFTLLFIVVFNIKKGYIGVYYSNWTYDFLKQTQSLFYKFFYLTKNNNTKFNFNNFIIYRFVFTSITSRLTSYFLFSFWLFFFFYGETLLLIMFNYSTLSDAITSSSFFLIKQHVIFFLITLSAKLTSYINFFIYFFTSYAFFFLINYNYSYNYNYFKHNYLYLYFINFIILISSILSLLTLVIF
jgi:hypothetical protein